MGHRLHLHEAVVPAMRERRSGTIVTISSVVAKVTFPLDSAYSSTKWAVERFSEALRLEVGHFGVNVVLALLAKLDDAALDKAVRSALNLDW